MPYILEPENKRLSFHPIKHRDIHQMYKTQLSAHWVSEEVDMSKDLKSFEELDENTQHFVLMICAFFASSDFIVNDFLETFLNEITITEIKVLYDFQKSMENIHSETYSIMLDTLCKDLEKRERLQNAAINVPCIKQKSDWAYRWIKSQKNIAWRILANAVMEGIFFSGSFCAIYWLKNKNVLPGFCQANEYIARDERMHTQSACLIFRNYIEEDLKPSQEQVEKLFREAIEIETEFINKSIPIKLIGMSSFLMIQYIKNVANELLVDLGYKPIFEGVKNPFDFMQQLHLSSKTNFFEHRVTQYQKASSSETKTMFVEMDDGF